MEFGTPHFNRYRRFLHASSLLLAGLFCCANVMAVTITIVASQKSPPDLSGAVVYLTPLFSDDSQLQSENVSPQSQAAPVAIAQENRQFTPYIQIVPAGTAVSFPNRDSVAHHVYSFSKSKSFELPLYQPGDSHTEVFDSPGLVTIGCNIHDWMLNYLLVVDTQYYGKLEKNSVEIKDLPVGDYTMSLWYPGLRPAKPISQKVTVESADQQLNFKVKKKLRKLRDQPSVEISRVKRRSKY